MSRPNFRIVENPIVNLDWEQFKKDYLNPHLKVKDICEKHDISQRRYNTLKKRLVEETGVAHKPSCFNGRGGVEFDKNKHIYKDESINKYRVSVYRNCKTSFFGNYDTFEEAVEVRDALIEHDWDKEYYRKVIKPKYHPSVDVTEPNGFEEDYLSGKLSVKELRKKYGLSVYQYYMISNPIKQKLGIYRKPIKVR